MTTFDAYVRHQVYVEGYKNGQSQDAETLYEEITAAIIIALNKLNINNLGELTKARLTALVRTVKEKMVTLFRKQVDLTLEQIKAFMNADLNIMAKLGATTAKQADTGVKVEKGLPVNVINRDKVWSTIVNDPVAGVGLEPKAIFAEAEAMAVAAVLQLLKRGWADNIAVADILRELVGTAALLRKDGLVTKQRRRMVTAIETVIQHVTTEVQFRVGQLTSSHYVWCSILDSRTTEICRSRNGNAYEYGKGPRPPAHWNCRSFTIPATIVKGSDIPTFYTWIKRQPAGFQDDVIGPARGKDLRDGKVKSDDLPGFERTRPLTVSGYADKVKQILTEVA